MGHNMIKSDLIIAQSEKVTMYETLVDDLTWVVETEQDKANASFVYQWSYEQHLAALSDSNILHYIVKDAKSEKRLGYVILDDVNSTSNSINLRRVVVCDKGHGVGRETIKLIKAISFKQLNAHRLWLDVFIDNDVAIALYASVGFTHEGILRESYLRDGRYVSQVIMSFLSDEYVEDVF